MMVVFDLTLYVFITKETECRLRILTSRNWRSLQLKHHNYVKWESISSPRHFISSMKFRSTYFFNACALYKCTSNAKRPWHTPSCRSCVFLSERNSGSRSVKGLLDTKSISPLRLQSRSIKKAPQNILVKVSCLMYGFALKISEIIVLLESMSIEIYSVEGVEGLLDIFSFEPLYRKWW